MKPEIIFGLENATWPALLVDGKGIIVLGNSAASGVFGPAVSGPEPKLGSVWSAENGVAPEDFFAMWEGAPIAVTDLKFKTLNGQFSVFSVAVAVFLHDNQQWFILQLLPVYERPAAPATAPVAVPVAAAAPKPTPAAAPVTPSKTPTPPATTPTTAGKPVSDMNSAILKQKLDCALQLARTVSLDFNNALTSVMGHTSLLLSKAEAGHPWRHSLLEVEKSAAHAGEIANELQTFSRNEKETQRTPPGNLNSVAQRCVDFFRNAHGQKIKFDIKLEKELFGARFDEAKVQQALTKILENAVEAVGGGEVAVLTRNIVLAEALQDANVRLAAGIYVAVEVTDNGPGIDQVLMSRIFEPFFTTKGAGHRGLGLALVYGIITNHGGGVAISSELGEGTTARIYLPAERGLVRGGAISKNDLVGTETIMVVDDEPLILTMAETILSEYGYKVVTATGGQKALALLARGDLKVDVVLTDLVMPGMSGRELIEKINQLFPDMKILCSSGFIMPERQAGGLFLQKPFSSTELLQKIRQTIISRTFVD
jgi:CheY-like chemotaxis protein